MLVEIIDEKDEEIYYERAFGIELDPHPRYRPWEWGDEAKHGYSIHWNVNTFCCPTCGTRIIAPMLRHIKDPDGWINACVFCDPHGVTAL